MNDSTWMSADPHLASSLSPSQDERMRSPQNLHSQEDALLGIDSLTTSCQFVCSDALGLVGCGFQSYYDSGLGRLTVCLTQNSPATQS
ncbi:hypothetical protein FD754_017724 [Muntiacus muntjak]|uniref:Uncharacterized protein n=1 Tax=Muntiacus muntjak TaxID=9888 RepID=A0A5N3VUR3_MUNMU|nr:hypothetical protein FD754_017724 [Muntiacus muntjak]